MVRIRHRPTESTRVNGGHISFTAQPSRRGKGFGKCALALALVELKKIGKPQALVTAYPGNSPSIQIIEANGGQLENTIFDPPVEHEISRYWINLDYK